MSDYEPMILAALSHQGQSTKKIAANIPVNLEMRSLVSTGWHYLTRMEKDGLVEVQFCNNPVRTAYWRLKE